MTSHSVLLLEVMGLFRIFAITETSLSPKVFMWVLQLTMGNKQSVANSRLVHRQPALPKMRFTVSHHFMDTNRLRTHGVFMAGMM